MTADEQTGGRGRLGRDWISRPGNLYATCLLRNPTPAQFLPQLALVAAIGVRAAVAAVTERHAPKVKWPNDVLVDGRKIAGILLEARTVGDETLVAIGCGVNCAHHPDGVRHLATSLSALGYECEPGDLFGSLRVALCGAVERWGRGRDFAEVREEWRRHAYGLGEAAKVTTPAETLSGVVRDIDDDGLLIIETNNGARRVAAGDLVGSAAAPEADRTSQ